MILVSTITVSMCNSGARKVKCIKVYKKPGRGKAGVGDVVKVIVISLRNRGFIRVKKSELHIALVTRISTPVFRLKKGYFFKFDTSAVVLLAKKNKTNSFNLIGTRIFGPCSKELRKKNYLKISTLASSLV
jgi:large subunit ribosomal protein L14